MRILVFGFAIMTLVSCSSPQQKKEPTVSAPAHIEIYRTAKSDFQKKEYRSALSKLHKIVADAPGTQIAADSQMLIGDIYFAQGRWTEANQAYSSVVNSSTKSGHEGLAAMKSAQCLVSLDKPTEALASVDIGLRAESLTPEQRVQGLKLRLQILRRLNSPLESLKTLLHLHAAADTEGLRQEYKLQALAIVEGSLPLNQIEEVARDSKYGFARPPALFRLGLFAFEKSDFSGARSALGDVVNLAPNTDLSERASELLSQISARETVNPYRIGVVLPLSGKLQKVAYRTLRGLQLGLGVWGKSKSNLELAVIDSGGSVSSARRGVEKLVTEDNVIGVVGSISSKEASAIANKAQELGVPSVSLSQKAGLTAAGDYVFQNALTSEMLVRQLVEEAIKVRGLTRFAILYPKDAYGTEYANLFWDEVVRQGGEIRGAQSYPPGETDVSLPIKKLVGTFDVDARKWEYKLRLEELKRNKTSPSRRDDERNLLPPVVDFDAVFIPDGAKAMGQIAPMLLYHDVRNVTLLGTNLWNTPALVERAGKAMKTSVFIDSFLAADPNVQGSAFYREFQTTFGEPPEEFELQAYDTGVILRKALESGATSRPELQRYLASLKGLPGAISPLTVNEQRQVQRPTIVLTLQDGQISRALDTGTRQ